MATACMHRQNTMNNLKILVSIIAVIMANIAISDSTAKKKTCFIFYSAERKYIGRSQIYRDIR